MRRRSGLVVLLASSVVVAASSVVAQPTTCPTPKTSCEGADGYYASHEDREALEKATDPILKELRTCLDGVGAKNLDATIVVRFDSEGKPQTTTVEAPGYESQLCVARIVAKLSNLKNPRETKVRCSFGCPKPPPPPSASTAPPIATSPVADAGAEAAPTASMSPLPPPIPPSNEEVEKLKYRFSFRGQAGYELGLIYGIAVHSFRGRLGFGSQNDVSGRYFVLDGRYGSTPSGLTNWDLRIGGEFDAVKSASLHIGLGAAGGILGIERVSNGRTLVVPTIGLYANGGFDIMQWGPRKDHALTFDLRLDAHVFFTGYYIGPGAVLGFRY